MGARSSLSAGFRAAGASDEWRPAGPGSGFVIRAPRDIGAGHVLGGRYVLERPLAAGGMGQVWIARHDALDRLVAVKLMAAETDGSEVLRQRFEREAKACAQLRSPHVVQVFDFGHEDGVPFLVMELLEGDDLAAIQHQRSRCTPAEVASWVREAAFGLHEAHDLGIVHRDIKLSNLFLARVGGKACLKVLDFGVARMTEATGRLVTAVDAKLGTTSYMSPEQLVTHDVDARADVWALAVVAFRLLTGHAPFPGETPMLVAQRIACFQRLRVTECAPHLSSRYDELFDRAFARPISARFQSVDELATALARLVAEGEALALPVVAPPMVGGPSTPAPPLVTFEPTRTAPQSWSADPPSHSVAGSFATDKTFVAGTLDAAEPTTARAGGGRGAGHPIRRFPWVVSASVVATVAAIGVVTVTRVLSGVRSSSPGASDEAHLEAPPVDTASTPRPTQTPPASEVSPASVVDASAAAPATGAPSAALPERAASASAEAPAAPSAASGAAARRPAPPRAVRPLPPEPPREPRRDLLDSPQ